GEMEEIHYISISDIDYRTMVVAAQQSLRIHEAPSRASYRVREGDIITAIAGASTGTAKHATALITAGEDGAICTNGFAVLRNVRGVVPFFLLAFMKSEYFLRQVRRLMTGHAIPAISLEDLAGVLVPVPSQEIQLEIGQSVRLIHEQYREALRKSEQIVDRVEDALGLKSCA
ncbi:MAG: N-6 DNA methylase, partial [Ardenticatenaceae bacterium]